MTSRRLLPIITAVLASVSGLASAPTAAAATPTLQRVVEYLRAPGAVNENATVDQAMSSPTFGDVTGDGVLDLVVGSMDGHVLVLNPTSGAVLRDVVVQSGSMIQGAPALVDVTGDGVLDVAVGTVLNVQYQSHVRIYDMTTSGGRLVFDQADAAPDAPGRIGFFGTPAIGDIDRDGHLEVVAINFDHRLYAWNLDGSASAGFPMRTYDTSLSSPALADVDGDGALDIVVGADMDNHPSSPLPYGGYLWVVNGRTGQPFAGYPMHLGTEVIWSSPAIGDLDADGDLDAVVGAGRNFFTADANKLYAIDLRTASFLPGWPRAMSGNTMSSPALADLDGDPQLEVVAATGEGIIHRLEHNGAETWTSCAAAIWQGCGADYAFLGSPVVADIDADTTAEVVVVGNRELMVFDASTGTEEFRQTIRSNPGDYAWVGANAAAVATDGVTTFVGVYVQVDNGDNVRRDGDRQGIYVWTTSRTPTNLPWAQFQNDRAHLGVAEARNFTSLAPGDDIPLGTTDNLGWFSNIDTALAVSRASWTANGATHAVIARDDNFADALAGTALLGDGPLLLTKTASLHPNVAAELDRVLAPGATVYLLGGTAAISSAVQSSIASAGYQPVRLSGSNRIGTALAVAQAVDGLGPGVSTVYLARSVGPAGQLNGSAAWADSGAVGAVTAAGGYRRVVLLTPTGSLDAGVDAALSSLGPSEIVLLGGTAAVSAAVEDAVRSGHPTSSVLRLAGADRAATAAAIATHHGVAGSFVLANGYIGDGWAAALPGAGLAARRGAAILWTPNTGGLPSSTRGLVASCTAKGGAKHVRTIAVGGFDHLDEPRLDEIEAWDESSACP